MTSSIPDSISSSDLENLMQGAKPEEAATPMLGATPEEQVARVIEKVEELSDEWSNVFSYKLIADYCIHQLFEHHKEVAHKYFEDGEEVPSAAWSRDAGHFQVIGKTLRDILCGPDDFLHPRE
jgi:hypothetical protein